MPPGTVLVTVGVPWIVTDDPNLKSSTRSYSPSAAPGLVTVMAYCTSKVLLPIGVGPEAIVLTCDGSEIGGHASASTGSPFTDIVAELNNPVPVSPGSIVQSLLATVSVGASTDTITVTTYSWT